MNKPLVSIIIPAYNHSLYIENCLDSITNQTYENIELIILNDGSTDDTNQKIINYENKLNNCFKRYEYINKENEGICKTLNLGLDISKGEYIIPFASDDVMYPERVEKQVGFLEKYKEFGMVFADGYHLESDEYLDTNNIKGKGLLFSEKMGKYYFNYGEEYSRELLYTGDLEEFKDDSFKFMLNNIFLIHSSGVCIRKECYDKVGIYDENLSSEDLDMAIRIAKVYKYSFIKEPLVIHRIHSSNAGRSFIIFDTLKSLIEKYNASPILNEDEKNILLPNLEKKSGFLDIKHLGVEIQNKKIVIWGTGSSYEKFKKHNSVQIDFFVDSNLKKQGKTLDSRIIYPPSKLLEINKENYYIVVASEFYKEIYYQLETYGFKYKKNYY